MKCRVILCLMILLISGCKGPEMLTTVNRLDLNRYQGTWYEIARLPNSFEGNLTSVTAKYTRKNNCKIEVINAGYKPNNKLKSIRGVAWVPKKDKPGQLKVRFFWPFSGDYYVIAIDDDYQYALVGSPSRKFLWVLAKQPVMPQDVYEEYLEIARSANFDIEDLVMVDQSLNLEDKAN